MVNAMDLNGSIGRLNMVTLSCVNVFALLVMLVFGIRVARYDPTDPVIYL